MNFYNEYDPAAAAWIRQLVTDKQIPQGTVDHRSITELQPHDIQNHDQAHFFCGIAGWPFSLDIADRESLGLVRDTLALIASRDGGNAHLWTASLPCQPFSSAGKQAGTDDERHLWPVFRNLVEQCRPAIILGEQVASKIAREKWLPGVCVDLQAMGYTVTAVDLCAPCAGEDGEGRTHHGGVEPLVIGAPHIRQRLYWVAYRGVDNTPSGGLQGSLCGEIRSEREDRAGEESTTSRYGASGGTPDYRMADTKLHGHAATERPRDVSGVEQHSRGQGQPEGANHMQQSQATGGDEPLQPGDEASRTPDHRESSRRIQCESTESSSCDGLGDTRSGGCEVEIQSARTGCEAQGEWEAVRSGVPGTSLYSDFTLIPCRDGKARRIERGSTPLVAGLPRGVVPSCDPGAPGYANETAEARVMRLKGYGNAICAPLAAMFIVEACHAIQDQFNTTP